MCLDAEEKRGTWYTNHRFVSDAKVQNLPAAAAPGGVTWKHLQAKLKFNEMAAVSLVSPPTEADFPTAPQNVHTSRRSAGKATPSGWILDHVNLANRAEVGSWGWGGNTPKRGWEVIQTSWLGTTQKQSSAPRGGDGGDGWGGNTLIMNVASPRQFQPASLQDSTFTWPKIGFANKHTSCMCSNKPDDHRAERLLSLIWSRKVSVCSARLD